MARKILLQTLVVAYALALNACGSASSYSAYILPENCEVTVGEQIPVTLAGKAPNDAVIDWKVTDGSIITTNPSLNALFTAPMNPTVVTITAQFVSTTPEPPVKRECMVLPAANGSPTATSPTLIASPTPADLTPVSNDPTIAITEVMSNPCGGEDFKKWNEYVELYNPGDVPVDVRGWWLFDRGRIGTPDSLVSWVERVPNDELAPGLVVDSTVIPPHGFAVILSPLYIQGVAPYRMPYTFPSGTIILTILDSDRLGDDQYGIVGAGMEPDFLVLYIGGSNSVQQVISTYGNPTRGNFLQEFHDTPNDSLPLTNLPECWSAKRIDPTKPDTGKNWYSLKNGSPGQGVYK